MTATIVDNHEPGAIGRIAQLHAHHYAAASGFGVAFEAKVARELGDFCLAFQPGRDGLWLAKGDEIEGSVAIDGSHADTDGAHLRWFITSSRLRGQGIGRQLLARALDFVDARGYATTHLWTFAGLDAARHLYESHGFHLVLERAGAQWGTVVQEQRFERSKP
jgi:GNAT superfamily N-acetyltransferase